MARRAVYHQKSDVVQEEFGLIETATQREVQVDQLFKIITAVKEQRRQLDNACVLETFRLFNEVRQTTIDLIKTVSKWQQSFTLPIRPRIFDCDYIVDRVVNHIDFINSTKVTKMFNFHFYRGNALLLPFPNQKVYPPVRINQKLANELRTFSAPDEDDIIFCYQFLLNTLPEKVYNENLASLSSWMAACWLPRVWVSDAQDDLIKQNADIMKDYARQTIKADKGVGRRRTKRLLKIARSKSMLTDTTSSPSAGGDARPAISSSGAVVGSSSSRSMMPQQEPQQPQQRINKVVSGEASAPSSRRSSTAASSPSPSRRESAATSMMLRRSSSGRVASSTHAPTKMQLKRRNQLTAGGVHSDAVGLTSSDSASKRQGRRRKSSASTRRRRSLSSRRSGGSGYSSSSAGELQEAVAVDPDEGLTEEEKEEKRRVERKKAELEQYYKEMEQMFIPRVGRRAVQTLAVGGEARTVNEMQQELEELHKPDRVFFLHTTKAEMDMRDRIIYGGLGAERFKRTNATLIAKKNRIVADGRGEELHVSRKDHIEHTDARPSAQTHEDAAAAIEHARVDDASVPSVKSAASSQSDGSSQRSAGSRQRRAFVDTKGASGRVQFNSSSRRSSRVSDVTFSPAPSRRNTLTSVPAHPLSGKRLTDSSGGAGNLNRRNSRRMSDLTVTFSMAEGGREGGRVASPMSSQSPSNKNPFSRQEQRQKQQQQQLSLQRKPVSAPNAKKKSHHLSPLPHKNFSKEKQHSRQRVESGSVLMTSSLGSVTQVILAAQRFRNGATSGKSNAADEDSASYSSASYSSNNGSGKSVGTTARRKQQLKKSPHKLPTVGLNLTTSTLRHWYAAEQNLDLISM